MSVIKILAGMALSILCSTIFWGSAMMVSLAWMLHSQRILHVVLAYFSAALCVGSLCFASGKPFIAASYLLVYGSSTLLWFALGISLPQCAEATPSLQVLTARMGLCSLVALGVMRLAVLPSITVSASSMLLQSVRDTSELEQVGAQLLGSYSLIFEGLGVTLLITLVGVLRILKLENLREKSTRAV